MEGQLARYLEVFAPFLATVVLAHLIVRSASSPVLAPFASRALLRRVLLGSTVAMAIIVAVDLLSGGDLFLRPSYPGSAMLAGAILVAIIAAHFALRALTPRR